MTMIARIPRQARQHWFALVAALLLILEYGFARTTQWNGPDPAEAAILFDLCLFVPFLHWLCYRRQLPTQALMIRTFALSLSGLYLATWLVPPEAQSLLTHLSWLRPIGLAALTLIELKLLIEIVRLAFSGGTSSEVSARTGAPEWIARLMLLEARFWKAVWRIIRGR